MEILPTPSLDWRRHITTEPSQLFPSGLYKNVLCVTLWVIGGLHLTVGANVHWSIKDSIIMQLTWGLAALQTEAGHVLPTYRSSRHINRTFRTIPTSMLSKLNSRWTGTSYQPLYHWLSLDYRTPSIRRHFVRSVNTLYQLDSYSDNMDFFWTLYQAFNT